MRLFKILKDNKKEINIRKIFFLLLYKLVLIYLPKSTNILVGGLSKKLRYECCKRIFKSCGKNVNVEKGANFGSGFELEIGDNSGLGIKCRVPSNIKIGKNVMMGPECYILDANHSFNRIDIPMTKQGHIEKKQTIIEDDVWIGREVLMTPGRIIKKGSIVGARCVLTKDFPEFSIVAGNPSKLIRIRE